MAKMPRGHERQTRSLWSQVWRVVTGANDLVQKIFLTEDLLTQAKSWPRLCKGKGGKIFCATEDLSEDLRKIFARRFFDAA
jgi:hypothetical protein